MSRRDYIKSVLLKYAKNSRPIIQGSSFSPLPEKNVGLAFAPANIALCKYWGKRDAQLNLPTTSSLSISLANRGALASIEPINSASHEFIVNEKPLLKSHQASQSFSEFLDDLFGDNKQKTHYRMTLNLSVPIAAGLASSACLYAAIVKAADQLYGWQLQERGLSILARLGSGSACRSIFHGFVEWHVGVSPNGYDSFAQKLDIKWPELRVGICLINSHPKTISSRESMQRTFATSPLYKYWPSLAKHDLLTLKSALYKKDFTAFGKTAEKNAQVMHALMLAGSPPVLYTLPDTVTLMERVYSLREQGCSVYFTQDAGPNLKLLFLEQDLPIIQENFKNILVINPFSYSDAT